MASDGLDASIKIPAVLITKSDGRKFKEVLCQQQASLKGSEYCKQFDAVKYSNCTQPHKLLASLVLDTPHPDKRVEYELWLKSDRIPPFLHSFEWFAQDLRKHSLFTPMYMVANGFDYQCDNQEDVCADLCLYNTENKNKAYCIVPDTLFASGKQILEENVRQYCIWKQDNETYTTKG